MMFENIIKTFLNTIKKICIKNKKMSLTVYVKFNKIVYKLRIKSDKITFQRQLLIS